MTVKDDCTEGTAGIASIARTLQPHMQHLLLGISFAESKHSAARLSLSPIPMRARGALLAGKMVPSRRAPSRLHSRRERAEQTTIQGQGRADAQAYREGRTTAEVMSAVGARCEPTDIGAPRPSSSSASSSRASSAPNVICRDRDTQMT